MCSGKQLKLEAKIVRGFASSVVFYHPQRYLSSVVHGDAFTFIGVGEDLKWIKVLMWTLFEIKIRAI